MGISGLLPLLKSIQRPCSLKKFSGQTIGVDAYGWLHRGTAACAIDLALDKPTTKYVDFAMNRVRMLIHFGITPFIVFDGDYLPSKAGTEKERSERRKEGKRLGLELLKVGKASQAQMELQKAVDVTPEMARMLIEELKHHNIRYVVAPYEADSQLAYLERQGLIDGILSEDSDLLVFGAKRLLTKLDKYGECVEICRDNFTACREVSLVGWSDADFRRMAMLSGCDYLPGIGKMGLKTAYRMLRKHKTVERLVKAAQFDGQYKVAPGYLDAFYQAENTFLYQWVFCPNSNRLVNLTDPASGVDVLAMPYIGAEVPANIAVGVARGDLHPHSKEPLTVLFREKPNARPLRPSPRAQVTAQTPDMKGSKPIDSFFKPKRTPLAELDPNIFTPSPSQQVLLEQQRNASWDPVMAPPLLTQARSAIPRTAPQPPRRTVSESFTRRSAPQPAKRNRLCSDNFLITPLGAKHGEERSPFFEPSITEPSPSLRNSKKHRKSSNDFELYSDDSIEEAMAILASTQESAKRPKKKKKLAVFTEDETRSSLASADSQSTIASTSTAELSQESTGTLTPATSFGSPAPESSLDTPFTKALSSQVKSLRSKFSYHALKMAGNVPSEMPTASGSAITDASPKCETVEKASSEKTAATPEDEVGELEHAAWASMEAQVVVAAEAKNTTVIPNSSPVAAPPKPQRLQLRGSEDMFVPDSDGESDGSPRRPILSLDRFAYVG
ncbi:PIN domain-like protein [Aaosphaeria arxii CBS 175.79]|uniref:PIN domain-like protein n=1 Tax=Aaosphaeria arxii CBS 175.79 TaxID=1450172 RepID=A0A6A5XFM4_9PLEO|nr:PIN domain-like protein [Aaosphaeria arxii CBS 175.79]KAF2011669.1 PIN domain-like protein [Aaosphaeria arxii CBS 175.79]